MSFRAIAYAAVVVLLVSPAPRGASPQPSAPPDRLTSFVNPFIGTGGHGHTFPGPSLPFGMIQPGPDTRLTGWDSSSGYHYSDTRIVGFSHTHLSGTGIPDYGDILLMPTTGEARLSNGLDGTPGYSSSFSHATEEAEPGYYAVTLNDYGIRAELTTTLRAGLHRYQFPAGRPAARRARPRASRRGDRLVDHVDSNLEVTGHRRSRSWAKDQRLYFAIRFSRPVLVAGAHVDEGPVRLRRQRRAAARESRHFGGQHRRRAQESQRRAAGLGLRRRAAGGQRRVGARARPHSRGRRHARPARRLLHRALSRDADAQRLHGRGRPVSRPRSRRPSGAGLHVLLGVLALGHVSRAPSAADADRSRAHRGFREDDAAAVPGGRTAAGVGARGQRDRHDDRLPRGAGDRGRDSQGRRPGASTKRSRSRRWCTAPTRIARGLDAYKRRGYVDGAETSECVSRTLEYAYDDWCIALSPRSSDGPPTRRGSSVARRTGATCSIPRRASCARASRATGSRRSIPPK